MKNNKWYSVDLQRGNYWDDYPNPVDVFSGPDQDIPDGNGIIDTPYDITLDGRVRDAYPLLEPYSTNNLPYVPSSPWPENRSLVTFIIPHFLTLAWDGGDPDSGDFVSYALYLSEDYPPKYHGSVGLFPAGQTRICYDLVGCGFGETY